VDDRARVGQLLVVAGVEGCGVAVRPNAEEDEVERLRQLDVSGAERVDLLLRDRDSVEERLPREALVGVLVIGRDEALVAPPDVPRLPGQLELGEALVDGPDPRSAGERDSEGLAPARPLGDPAGPELG
jgi:hypothetical protein